VSKTNDTAQEMKKSKKSSPKESFFVQQNLTIVQRKGSGNSGDLTNSDIPEILFSFQLCKIESF
jgi:hypothetical protein